MSALVGPQEYQAVTGGWDYASLPANVHLGKDCFLERKDSFKRYRSLRDPGLVLGERVQVHTWTEFNIEPEGEVRVGADSILVGAILMCAQSIQIGQRVVISYNVTIADSDFHPIDPDLRKQDAIANAPQGNRNTRPTLISRPVIIGNNVWIGIGAVILKGVCIGDGASIAAGAIVTSNIPPGSLVAGNPASISRKVDFTA
jgi:acetyltransferase-like isoleucine patch superfamily enzyme